MASFRCHVLALGLVATACGDPPEHLKTAQPGVVFAFPANGQLDVPTGSRVIVSFSDPVSESAIGTCTATSGAFCLIGPNGPVAATPEVSEDRYTVSFPAGQLDAGARYELFVRSELAPSATNLPSGPLVTFTTRSSRARAAVPRVVAINGGDPMTPEAFRPLFETSTIRLVFSEPLDPRTVALAAGSLELLDSAGSIVPATIFSHGIHVSIDPKDDLAAGSAYMLRIGNQLLDTSGQAAAPGAFMLTPQRSHGTPLPQVLRTRQPGDPGPDRSRSGVASNEIVIEKPLIGREVSTMLPTALAAELGDPKALGGPIAFTIRRGQRLRSTGMNIALGGEIPVGLSTGDVWIELLTDAGGRMYRNPHQAPEQRPENERAPVYVDLSLDIAVYAEDPQGNAVLTQTVLGVQAVGTAVATEGVLAIETVACMELALLGVTVAPTNLVLELITDTSGASAGQSDTTPPTLVASYPEQSSDHAVDDAIDLVFSEPIDLERARDGGLRLEDSNGDAVVPASVEGQGAAIVLRPRQPLQYGRLYRVVFNDVADVAGNTLTRPNLSFTTATYVATNVPMHVTAVHPGVPCALTGGTATSPGRCAGGSDTDSLYGAFTMPADDSIEVAFTQPVRRSSVTLGTACGSGSVRVEEADMANACTAVVPGSLIVRDRMLVFVPDVPWVEGKRYRLVLVSGNDENCGAGELCGPTTAANFDPLAGATNNDGGGPPLVIPFVGGPRSSGTHIFTTAAPITDINGSFERDGSEIERDENRAAMRITGTSGGVDAAIFSGADCLPETPEHESCMYLTGAMPTELGEITTSCGSTGATSCVPVKLAPEAMYGTSTTMTATVFGFDITTDTNVSIMRVREPASGPITGYVIDRGGTPTLVVTLDLYMDAPDMNVPFSDHDLHSKPLSVALEGPMTFLQDGRISIALQNTADIPIEVNISNFASDGSVQLLVPAREMRLQLVSPPPRGRAL